MDWTLRILIIAVILSAIGVLLMLPQNPDPTELPPSVAESNPVESGNTGAVNQVERSDDLQKPDMVGASAVKSEPKPIIEEKPPVNIYENLIAPPESLGLSDGPAKRVIAELSPKILAWFEPPAAKWQ